jgi:hypothetical protein
MQMIKVDEEKEGISIVPLITKKDSPQVNFNHDSIFIGCSI